MSENSPSGRLIGWCLRNPLIVFLLLAIIVLQGLRVAPFDWNLGFLSRDPVAVDAIPNIGENQQIVFTEWAGRSPQDVEDQITYPLTTALLGMPGIKTVRSYSMFGFSTIYVIFEDDIEFYWSRSRILEKLASLPAGTLPGGVEPTLGPDATALGQVFWYTLEGRDPDGNPAGGWDLGELRSIQDWQVRYALASAGGVAEVASIGGFVKEYQIDVDPDAMRTYGVTLQQVFNAVRDSNMDIGARTVEINKVEYVIRGLGQIESVPDIENTVVKENDGVPILVKNVATVSLGPAMRRGALDKEGAEAVGGVVVVRHGENPLSTIQNVKAKMAEIAPGLPSKTLADGTVSQVAIVPFYDRTGLIHETLGTLGTALLQQILITMVVVLLMIRHFASAILISIVMPISVLICFIAMKVFGIEANIVALSGIAIAIGTMVDMGIVLCENILRHLKQNNYQDRLDTVLAASHEVAGAVFTAIATTVVGFLPVFALQAAEGKLFKPLAYTKTFALIAAVAVALTLLPVLASIFFKPEKKKTGKGSWILAGILALVLAAYWRPFGYVQNLLLNILFTVGVIGLVLLFFHFVQKFYSRILQACLRYKKIFLLLPLAILVSGGLVWKNLGREFMPALDEGSFLFMPTTMPHASIGEALDVMQKQDMAIRSVPEVESVVGKLGRVESALDPAPISMFETVINYKAEYGLDTEGKRVRQWRDHIQDPDDIWNEIIEAVRIPGTTSAPKLQPIETRLVMLSSGMRAAMGVKVRGPDLQTIEQAALEIEGLLKQVPSIKANTVLADRIVGKPYLEIGIDREAIARHGLSIRRVQETLEVALGGKTLTVTIEGRKRYPVRVRYPRELRMDIEAIENILVAANPEKQIPLKQLAKIEYVRGPQVIKSEDTFLTGYVTFGKEDGFAEVDVVEEARQYLQDHLIVLDGVSYTFAGAYENQVRATQTLSVVLPVALAIIFMLLYLQFKSVSTTLFVFSGVFVAWAGGFVLIGLYAQDWFLDLSLFGTNLRDLFQIHPINLSVAVWVGFLALFGIATDDGVVMCTYLVQRFKAAQPKSKDEVRALVLEAGKQRIRPCLMTTATTILALLPVLTATGRGADIMIPMAIPVTGGMAIETITMFVVPVLYCWRQERKLKTP
ncbi:MAG: efflux RND transporter permease subunit [Verrucomicrobiota bacterium]